MNVLGNYSTSFNFEAQAQLHHYPSVQSCSYSFHDVYMVAKHGTPMLGILKNFKNHDSCLLFQFCFGIEN